MTLLADKIKTVYLLMFENRSFDHMLGHLSLEDPASEVRGLRYPLKQDAYKNLYDGDPYYPFQLPNDSTLSTDLPHEYTAIRTQLRLSPVTNKYTMGGFVESFLTERKQLPNPQSAPMGFFGSREVPVTSFLAKTFCTCDNWFASLPSSTQPNRTFAFTGDSSIFRTHLQLIKTPDTLFHWLERNKIRWRVYHDGLSFFVFYPQLWDFVFGDHFRDYEHLYHDLLQPPAADDPQVVIIEPSYADAPHIGPDHPNDNHAPLAIGWGEDFLRRTYEAIAANRERWTNSAMVVYYDEHGGFYDHVPPPAVPYTTTGDQPFSFSSLGVRIPGLVVSPWVKPGSVSHDLFDHSSVLQFLADTFTPGKPYSASVQQRSQSAPGIRSLSATLTADQPAMPAPAPDDPIIVKSALGDNIKTAPDSSMGQSFELAANQILDQRPADTGKAYPELFQWRDAVRKARG